MAIRHLQEWSSWTNIEKINMPVFIAKMRQISDVEIDDGTCIDPCSVFTIFFKNSVWAINHKCNFRKLLSMNPNQLSQKRRENHQGEKSNYNQNKLEKIQLKTKAIRSAPRHVEIIDPPTNPKSLLEANKNENQKFPWYRSKKLSLLKKEIY